MSWDISTLRTDHGDATAFRVEARHEFIEVLVTDASLGPEVAPVILDPSQHHPSRRAETESRVAGDERLDALAEPVGEVCHGGVLADSVGVGIGMGLLIHRFDQWRLS